MEQHAAIRFRLPIVAIGTLAAIGCSAAAFYGWIRYGSSILLALGDGGLSWCF